MWCGLINYEFMKILLINKFLYPKGGAEVVLIDEAKLLRQKGHDIVLWGMKHAFKYLRRPNARKRIGHKGVILNIASLAGLVAERGWVSYDISKASVIAATKVAALE